MHHGRPGPWEGEKTAKQLLEMGVLNSLTCAWTYQGAEMYSAMLKFWRAEKPGGGHSVGSAGAGDSARSTRPALTGRVNSASVAASRAVAAVGAGSLVTILV